MKQIPYYERDVDFEALAKQDADFAAIAQTAKSRGFIDFRNPKIVQQLAKSLLNQDFKLSLSLPDDRLCPPIPVRWNYIRWIQDLLDTTDSSYRDTPDPSREVVGLDIGIGASCIYALLACSKRPEWRMAGTDIDVHSLECAQQNINVNGLGERIKLKHMQVDGPILPLDLLKIEEMDFTMTNPPFYSSQQDFQASSKHGSAEDSTAASSVVCTGAENEMICEGGDVGFVMRILRESLVLRERVQWYTAMLSKLASLQQVVAALKEHGISNYAVTSLQPGQRTKRWAVAWSFGDMRPRNDISRHGELVQAVLPLPTAQTISTPMQDTIWAGKKVDETIKGLDVKWQWRSGSHMGVMEARENVWSRAARRKKKFQGEKIDDQGSGESKDEMMVDESEEEEPVALAVKITCKNEEVDVRWLRGHDHVVFSSFCGMLKRALTGRV
ncbi:uncharacterized protein RCC_05556 [Ramularia collo-cygni]|uniref:U6 small nuclear RNA (adenine-(43)-N(6))-methyltransferase n=1 Tax=Ramularia collo-cygni TaxID=112498 RepID=A0A2D3VAL4_9PEZI|nr:uncharacterized protein RCC_05556 [Ramularia collo-cygni]CZT19704.1 uncharacterized protein RCC_05556 [Ramularia collo-cygni]